MTETKLPTQTNNFQIDSDNQWDDSLGREQFGKFFCKYLTMSESPSIVELAAGYGEGKTYFLKRCKIELDTDSTYPIYLNIWEQDYYNYPLLFLLDAFNKHKCIDDSVKELNISRLKSILNITPSILSAAITGTPVPLKLGDMIFKKNEDTPESIIKEIRKIIQKIDEKSKELKRIIVFIDELDRCRPDYAIQVLEVIKHIFSIKNVVFVIATDDNRLKACVESVYGVQSSNEDYLRKFVDVQFILPETTETDAYKLNVTGNPNIEVRQYLLMPSLRESDAMRYSWQKFFNTKPIDNNIDKMCKSNTRNEMEEIHIVTFMFMFMLRHMKPDLYFKIGNKGIRDSVGLSQLKLCEKGIEDGFIKDREDFQQYIRAICTPSGEMQRFIKKDVLKDEKYYGAFQKNENWGLNDLRTYNPDKTNPKMFEMGKWIKKTSDVGDSSDALVMYKVIRDHALILWLNKHISNDQQTLAQKYYNLIEEKMHS